MVVAGEGAEDAAEAAEGVSGGKFYSAHIKPALT
jgi:hypothetical protein